MVHQTLELHAPPWLKPAGRKLRRIVARSAWLRMMLLGVTSVFGTLLMLSPALVLAGATALCVYFAIGVRGPLDWLLFALSTAIGLVAALLTVQLLRLRPTEPDGVELTRAQEPVLFEMLDRRVAHFRTGPIARVILRGDTQLTMTTTPRIPLPLLHSRTLCVGAPLLLYLSVGQFRLALAGGIGGCTLGRNGLIAWIVQSLQDWPVIASALESHGGLLARLMVPVARRIASVAAALGYELNCELQLAQGRWVLDNAGEQAAAHFLASQVVAQAFLDDLYWPMIYGAARRSPSPVVRPFSQLPLLLARLVDDDQCRRWLLRAQAGGDARQQELPEMLAGLNVEQLTWPGLPDASAFNSVFSSRDALHRLDKHWQRSVAKDWRRRYRRFQQNRKRFERLHRRAATENLHGDAAIRYVKLARQFLDKADAVAAYLKVCRSNRDDAGIYMLCGRELLAAGYTAEARRALQRASELQPGSAGSVQELVNRHEHARRDEQPPLRREA